MTDNTLDFIKKAAQSRAQSLTQLARDVMSAGPETDHTGIHI